MSGDNEGRCKEAGDALDGHVARREQRRRGVCHVTLT